MPTALLTEMKSNRAKFLLYNVLVATPIILSIPYLPGDVKGHDVFFPILGAIFGSFFVVSLVLKNRILISLLYAILWSSGATLAGVILAVIIHGIGPCL
jgi:hypothetical protein